MNYWLCCGLIFLMGAVACLTMFVAELLDRWHRQQLRQERHRRARRKKMSW